MTGTVRTIARPTATFPRRISLKALIDWLVEADRRYREAAKLRSMPDVRLKDLGLTRREADRAFVGGKW